MAEKAAPEITVFEVGPRDGIQNESRQVTLEDKIWFVNALVAAGVRELELGAFVRSDKVPRMADTSELFSAIHSKRLKLGRAKAWSLVPNRKGLERAVEAGARQIAVFTAVSETFNKKNIGMSVQESLAEYRLVVKDAHAAGIQVRGYVSTVFGCPYEGRVSEKRALKVIEKVSDLGVSQVSIGDTIGVATPAAVVEIFKPAIKALGRNRIAAHFHDTRGTALANTLRAIDLGTRTVDASAGGLGGCPFAPGATGNLATEDLVYMLNGMGLETGVQLDKLCEASLKFATRIGRPLSSRYLQAYASKKSGNC